jgi:signal transduction histidine kinase
MWSPGDLARRLAGGTSSDAPDGPAMMAMRLVAVRTAVTIRCIAIAYIVVQVGIWHSFYTAGPWRLAGPAAAVAWGAVLAASLRRRPGAWLAGADSGVHVALALGAQWCVPAAMRGDTANWLYIVMAGQMVVPVWFAPLAASAPLVLMSGAAYWAGAAATPAAGAGSSSPAAAAALLLAVAVVAWCASRMLYGRAADADVALARADMESREQYVVLARSIERREHERLLHDTVLNTLTALARPGSGRPGEVIGRCRHDVTLMEYVLSDPGDPANVAGRAFGGLLAAIEAVASEMRARGLTAHVQFADGIAAGPGVPAVPVRVSVAAARAVREALANVISHAGTGEAWVEISLTAPGADGEGPGGLLVTVRDAGAGFDPACVDPARLGLRRSIIERVADSGGQASVRSAPGAGTVLSLCWPALQRASESAAAGRGHGRAGMPW